jgi:hypothetical protein
MIIFLSHSGAQRDMAHRLALSLEGQGHTVFFDHTDLEQGQEFDGRIRQALEDADLFVFLISPESVADGSYPLAELGMAERLWPRPEGRVLPILARPVPIDRIPPYARAVSILKPRGDFVAESAAAVARLAGGGKRRRWKLGGAAALVVLAVLVWLGYTSVEATRVAEEREEEVRRTLAAAGLDIEAGQYEAAFRTLSLARQNNPDDERIRRAHEQNAMLWARNIRVVAGKQTFAEIVNLVRPVLSDGVTQSEGADAADLLAHLGWCEYLLDRETAGGDPVTYFKRAIEKDPQNPYAEAMWGFWNFFKGGSLADVTDHFDRAASTGREREWVRNLQISTLLLRQSSESEGEAVRVADTMRTEKIPVTSPSRLWNVYNHYLFTGGDETANFLKVLSGANHLLTFEWLFPETEVREDRTTQHRFMLGRLQEAAGNRDNALESYRWVAEQVKNSPGRLQDRTIEGLKRLSSK